MKRVCLILLSAILLIASTACTGEAASNLNEKESSELIAEYVSEVGNSEETSETNSEKESSEMEEKSSGEITSEEQGSGEPASEETSSEDAMTNDNSEEQKPEFTIAKADETYYAIKSVNVRKGPSTDYDRIGSLQIGEEVHVTGIADTGWFQIDYNGETGYFADSFAVDKETYLSLLEAEIQNSEEKKQEEPPVVVSPPVESGGVKADLVAIMNTERTNNGVGGIVEDATLDQLAQIRAQEIYSKFEHTRPDGTSCFTVLSGVPYYTAGENIAAGQETATEVMTDWMNSPGHRANILNASFNKVGIGYYTTSDGYQTYWVQLFTD